MYRTTRKKALHTSLTVAPANNCTSLYTKRQVKKHLSLQNPNHCCGEVIGSPSSAARASLEWVADDWRG